MTKVPLESRSLTPSGLSQQIRAIPSLDQGNVAPDKVENFLHSTNICCVTPMGCVPLWACRPSRGKTLPGDAVKLLLYHRICGSIWWECEKQCESESRFIEGWVSDVFRLQADVQAGQVRESCTSMTMVTIYVLILVMFRNKRHFLDNEERTRVSRNGKSIKGGQNGRGRAARRGPGSRGTLGWYE